MAQPVTTTDLFLQEIAASLVEIRDLLQDAQPPKAKAGQIQEPATARPAKKTAAARSKTTK